jgi:hypothetical protein
VAKRKTLFDDRPVEISELTYVIKQDLAALNQNIASLQALTHAQHPKSNRSKTDQEGEHNDNVSEAKDAFRRLLIGTPGRCYVAGKAGRCWRQLQRGS